MTEVQSGTSSTRGPAVTRALHHRRFALLWGGQTISRVGDHLYQAIRFPDHPRPSIARVLRAFAEVTSDRESTKAI